MAGKLIVHGINTILVAPLDLYLNNEKIGHVKMKKTVEIPITTGGTFSIRCGVNLSRPKVQVSGEGITEIQCKYNHVLGTFSIEIVSEDTAAIEKRLLEKKQEQERLLAEKARAQALASKEYRKRCNVCGHIFCYTQKDLNENATNSALSVVSGIGQIASALGGTRYDMYEQNKMGDRISSKIKDYSKCPHCNSSDLIDITDEPTTAPAAVPAAPVSQTNVASELKQFKELLDMGIITQEEFDAKKKQLLGL